LENVADLEALRQHLGAEKVSLWGISYGSHLALAALKQMEDRIDRIVIASAEGLDQTIKLPARTDNYFEHLGSAIGHEDLPGLIRRVHAQLDAAPPRLQLSTPTGDLSEFLLQRRDMQRIASAMISDPDRAKMLVGLYESLDAGDTGPVTGLMSRFVRPNEPISFNLMSVAMDIASGTSTDRRALIEEQAKSSLLGPYLNQAIEFEDTAENLVLSESFRINPVSDVPVLLLSGTLDGRTYLSSQIEAVSGLSDLDHMIIDGAGHNLFMWSTDVTERIQSFMRRAHR
jgi:pimeloyl-ACP methyl ester carboxylesterase